MNAPFFIVGCGRSGTTLLRSMLDHHPQVAIPVESLFIVDYLRAPASIPPERVARLLVQDREFAEWGMPLSLDDLAGCDSPRAMIDRIHEKYAQLQGKTRWGQKTPRFVRYGDLLRQHYPAAKFINVLRDPRAVVNSLIRSNLHRSNAYFAAKRWIKDVEAGQTLTLTYPEDVLDVRFEALVSDPEPVLRTVCQFLNLSYDEAMLDYYQRGTQDFTPFFDQIHANLEAPPRPNRIDAWKDRLSGHDIELVESLTASWMERLGYEAVSSASAPPAGRIALLKLHRYWSLLIQIGHRLIFRFGPLYSFVWRKLRLGVFWRDLQEVNY